MLPQLKQRASAFCLPCMLSIAVVEPLEGSYPPALLNMNAHAVSQSSDAVSWDALSSMRYGVKLRLLLTDGSEVVGHLVAARVDAVVLDRNKVRNGPYTAPAGISLRDPLTFQRSQISSVEEAKGWPFWAKAVLWVGIVWVAAGVIIGSIVGNS